ncbi:PQQ-dependent sugar dehydrogenase [Sphaerisporangium sp. TRM90804]|uniref:PQQ-dependent sugar dehydrogenase n=1 Tax=Sphaerisporangium sp. TRM90804 TaxID=3031113 RepID=UPI0024479F7F|nr:PQQ-dependent sugar dehydrogenase [Sphaerisporangium sp. TRM90804]MDH2428655.1 PQQ-dependent sugar dehydrogenase [Sphaerisporangium sp. TRM90804]
MSKFIRTLLSGVLVATALVVAAPLAGPALAHPGHDPATEWSDYEKITLTKTVGEPIDLAVLPDRRVLHTARTGEVRLTDPATGVTKVVSTIPVYNNSEDGLQTIAIDPGFAENKWVYVYYAPKTMTAPYPQTTPTGSAPTTLPAGADASYWDQWKGYNQLSRFKWTGDALDLSTEQVIIKVEVQRGQCCHVAGDLDWDDDGNLYLATGDNTPAGAPGANGFAPNNDAPGVNPGMDTRRGAGNTNDLRGKILRIKVGADGAYTVPEGNLFPQDTAQTRPEIFVMGVRNPFRMDVDGATGTVSWADYGPDAGAPDAARGPMGYVEWNVTPITKPINAGWPYCTGDQFNYNDWDFATAQPRAWFDCAAGAANTSRWNTGLDTVPPAVAADLYYGDNNTQQPAAWAGLTDFDPQTGQGPMGGPVYHYDAANPSPTKFPEYWDGKFFFAEFSQDYLAAFTVTGADGPVTAIEHFLPNSELRTMGMPITDSPMDIEFGPDGSLYVLDYGNGFFRQNPEAGLYRIDYTPGNKSPQAKITADPVSSGSAPLTVEFSGAASTDSEPGELRHEWDFDGDGTFDATGVTASHTYDELGQYVARLRVTDAQGKFGLAAVEITVGNTAPKVSLDTPGDGAFLDWGDAVPFRVRVTDEEDGDSPVCSRVQWSFGLGHDTHAHPLTTGTGCTGAWPTPVDAPEHGETENIYGVVVVSYRDNGANGIPGALGDTTLILNPKLMQAEHADAISGVTRTEDATASALSKITSFDAGDWIAYDPVNLAGITSVTTRATGAGTLSLRWDSATAEPFATVTVPAGDGWQTATTPLPDAPEGSGRLYVTSSGGVDVDAFTFVGDGAGDTKPPVVTATLNPAQPGGENGWYTGNVTLTVTATDDGTVSSRQYSLNGGTTWANANNPVTLSTEGTTEVRYRATDNGGNVSPVGTVTVRIDKTAPAVTVSGVQAGPYGDSASITPVFAATDATSGLASVTASIGDRQVTSGTAVPLWTLPLGENTLTVTGRDKAGLTTEREVVFQVETSFADVRALLETFRKAGKVKGGSLAAHIKEAEKLAGKGQKAKAIDRLEKFVKDARDRHRVTDPAVRDVLVRDAQALIAGLRA